MQVVNPEAKECGTQCVDASTRVLLLSGVGVRWTRSSRGLLIIRLLDDDLTISDWFLTSVRAACPLRFVSRWAGGDARSDYNR